MTETELEKKAVQVAEDLVRDTVKEARVVHCTAEVTWYRDLLRRLSEHELTVLERDADIIVFFDESGKPSGWRDDGRLGAPGPVELPVETVREKVVAELDLPADTRAGHMAPVELPPVGWTLELVLFPGQLATEEELIRVWVAPQHQRVIQVLYGKLAAAGGSI